MGVYPEPEQLWKSPKALKHAREAALNYARRELTARRATESGVPAQAMLEYHLGYHHLGVFRDRFPQIIESLPQGFRALEVGAGMGWHAALLAACSTGSVVATEYRFAPASPYNLNNVHTLHRLAEREPQLNEVVSFQREDGALRSMEFSERVRFAQASAEELPFPGGSLNLVYSVNCVEHLHDLAAAFAESARVLRPGGYLYATTQPLYFSMYGHHLLDFLPLPWGHLLWTAEELAELVMKEAGEGREWAPGEPLRADHLVRIVREDLNYETPEAIRRALLPHPWSMVGWLDLVVGGTEALAREIGLFQAIRGVHPDALLINGLRFRLRRTEKPEGLRLPLRLTYRTRRLLKRALGR